MTESGHHDADGKVIDNAGRPLVDLASAIADLDRRICDHLTFLRTGRRAPRLHQDDAATPEAS